MSRNDTEKTRSGELISYIIYCLCSRLKEYEALKYLKDKGFSISRAQYYRLRQEVKQGADNRLNHIGAEEFKTQHLERLDTLKTIENELWSCYHSEQNPTKKSSILMHIAEIQQYLAAFYDSTQYIMQEAARMKTKEVNHA